MKKILFILFASTAFFACNNDEQTLDNNGDEGLVFEITTKTQSIATRAGAPVYSQDTSHTVARVSVYAFKSDGTDYLYVKTYDIPSWTTGVSSRRYTVPNGDKLAAGDYKFLAVGRDLTDEYELTTLSAATKLEDVTASIAASGDEYEIFAGVAQANVLAQGGRVSINLTRQVAGVLGYFKNVPQILDGKTVRYLRLIASEGNKEVNLTSGIGSDVAVAYDIFNIDLSTQTVADEMYTGNNLSTAGIVKLPNSQLSGAYMIPVDGITLTLGLYDASNVAIKTWTVKDGTSTTFDITANHFYSLGVKRKPGTITGTVPADNDDAIDLLQDQAITIIIDPAWSTIHSLVIE